MPFTAYNNFLRVQAEHRAAAIEAQKGEFVLWRATKDGRHAMAHTRRHPAGLELCITVEGELWWSRAFRPDELESLLPEATAKGRAMFEAGWAVVET